MKHLKPEEQEILREWPSGTTRKLLQTISDLREIIHEIEGGVEGE